MKHFNLSYDTYTTGFQYHVTINPLKPIDQQLGRQRILTNAKERLTHHEIRELIEYNASLRVDFGWSFESTIQFNRIIDDCLKEVIPKYNPHVGRMVSDLRCSWLGFEPHNMYDKEVYKNLTPVGLIIYNNEIVDFQTDVIKILSNHQIYKQHAFLRDEWYRFESFKSIRKDRDLLEEKFHYYIRAIHEVSLMPALPRDILEKDIGTHFLHHPDLFHELLEFYILKGEIYE